MKRLCIGIIGLCIISGGLFSCTWRRVTLEKGRELEKQGEYLEALNHYERMPDQEFGDTCQHNLKVLYGDILEALLAQQADPSSAEAYYQLGKAYYEKASSIPENQEIQPNQWFDSQTYFAEQQAQFHGQAEVSLEAAIEHQRSYAIASTAAPSGQMQIQSLPAQLPENYKETLLLAGNLYEDMGAPDKAIARYQQLVNLQVDSPVPFYRLGVLLYARGQTEEAVNFAKRAVELDADDPNARYVLGILYAQEGYGEQAIPEFHEVLCSDLNYTEPYYKIAQIYLEQNNLIDAERVLRFGLIHNPDSLRLDDLYGPLKLILDTQEQQEARVVAKRIAEETVSTESFLPTDEPEEEQGPSSATQLRQLKFHLRITQRQEPYGLPCTEVEGQLYFTRRIASLKDKIEQLAQSVQPDVQPDVQPEE